MNKRLKTRDHVYNIAKEMAKVTYVFRGIGNCRDKTTFELSYLALINLNMLQSVTLRSVSLKFITHSLHIVHKMIIKSVLQLSFQKIGSCNQEIGYGSSRRQSTCGVVTSFFKKLTP